MKILLIGEYSRLHNSLKEGLQQLGYNPSIFGFNDGFKDYPVDFKLEKKWDNGILKKAKLAVLKLTGFDISSYLIYRNFIKNQNRFTGYDIVQLINENSFYCNPYFEKKILQIIFEGNKKVFLLSCGDDYLNVKYYFDHPEFKSPLQPYFSLQDAKGFAGALKFREAGFRELHEYIYNSVEGVIASDVDYLIPLVKNPKFAGIIANPVNTAKINYQPFAIRDKINIFLGINDESYHKKGIRYFEDALKIIESRHSGKVNIVISRNRPYTEYINLYNSSHILLDQTYAHDQGYNALEAMAKGKVVFTGAEKEFVDYYKLSNQVAINAIPDVDDIVGKLEDLIKNPQKIVEIASNARAFIEKEHNYIRCAEKYLKLWTAKSV